jgi:hypothetical protein
LASSLNVELVYSILKGITQFGYLTLCEPEKYRHKLDKMQVQQDTDSLKITLSKIKIKNSKNWEDTSQFDL